MLLYSSSCTHIYVNNHLEKVSIDSIVLILLKRSWCWWRRPPAGSSQASFSYSVLQEQVEGQHLGTSSWHPGNAAVSGKSPRRLSPAAKGGRCNRWNVQNIKMVFCFFVLPTSLLPSPVGAKGRHVNPAPASGNCYLQVPTVRFCFSLSSFTNSARLLQTSSSLWRRAARQRSEIKLIQKKKTECWPFWCQLPLACSCCGCCCCYPW